ncbi:hypothetical protein [Brevundimonas goettingensis]|uniref:Uncharacterized protein n=1 Tax=Brevundimonas goettingensis TaxID=2774190 RepID=A0A975C1F3_9CAUL|nr:hypothetical protein [Brevundimonas goettingensis]QTC89812.1 hypothetical protein IFJ75_10895 [Brevundimonas goettingensis]
MKAAKGLATFGLVIGLGLMAGAVQAQELWSGATAGMSTREVLRIFPTALAASDPVKTTSFGKLLVSIPDQDVFGHRGRAEFYFEADQLNTVRLWIEPKDLTELSNRTVLERMQAELPEPPDCFLGMCVWRLPTRTVAFSDGRVDPPSAVLVEYTGPSPYRSR